MQEFGAQRIVYPRHPPSDTPPPRTRTGCYFATRTSSRLLFAATAAPGTNCLPACLPACLACLHHTNPSLAFDSETDSKLNFRWRPSRSECMGVMRWNTYSPRGWASACLPNAGVSQNASEHSVAAVLPDGGCGSHSRYSLPQHHLPACPRDLHQPMSLNRIQ